MKLPFLGIEPRGTLATEICNALHGQCDARPTVTYQASEHHHPLTGTKL